jgi:hypothetical protein
MVMFFISKFGLTQFFAIVTFFLDLFWVVCPKTSSTIEDQLSVSRILPGDKMEKKAEYIRRREIVSPMFQPPCRHRTAIALIHFNFDFITVRRLHIQS